MFDVERQKRILEILEERKTIGVNELAEMVFCSGSTLRRDLNRLEKKGLVIRSFGAVSLNATSSNNESSFEIRERISMSEKRELAQKAASLVKPNSTIFIDSSSTLFFIIPFLKHIENLLIVTNGLRIASETLIKTNHTVIMLGGVLQPNTNSVVGPLAYEQVQKLHADLALFSCYGINAESGTSEASADTASLKKEMAKRSSVSVCVFDVDKTKISGTFSSVPLEDIDYIITDGDVSKEFKKALNDKGVKIIL